MQKDLICYWSYSGDEAAVYNPTTRQSFYLPKRIAYSDTTLSRISTKVLYLPLDHMEQACQVFTLGDLTAKQWRTIQCVRSDFPLFGAVCINGVIYYRAKTSEYDDYSSIFKLMSFDVRSEKFYHVDAPKALFVFDKLPREVRIRVLQEIWVLLRTQSVCISSELSIALCGSSLLTWFY